jgi:HK97 family phage prohead protease
MNRRITKLFNIDIKSIDEEKRQVTFCFSDDSEDRMGEVVDQASWDVKNYMNNPIILWGHNPEAPENVLGQGVNLDLNKDGKSFITAQFDDAETNPKADMVFRQLIKRTLRCVSAGFINHTYEHEEDTPVLRDNELLEVSIVPIPANPRAVALALKDGSLSTKDAKWLMESMNKEATFIQKQLDGHDPHKKEKSMTEEQATELLKSIEKLTTAVETANEKIAAQDEKIDALTEQLKEAEETEEAKNAREAEEAADKEAAEKAEEERLAKEKEEEEAKNAGPNDDDEITPELQEQIDAEIEAQIQADLEAENKE